MLGRSTLLGLALLLSACGGLSRKASVPAAMRGDTPLVVVDHTPTKLCWLFIDPPGSPSDQNWLRDLLTGAEGLEVNETRTFNVKNGSFVVRAEGCYHEFAFQNVPLRIAGPTYLNVGDAPATPPDGYKAVTLRGKAQTACEDPGLDIDSPHHCCSKHAHREYKPYNRLVCD
jgi:hypothetical protein